MTNFISKTFRICALTLLVFSLFINACKKEETNVTTGYVRVVNASPSSPTYNVYFSGTLLSTAALPYAGSVAYRSYPAGSYNIKFTSANSAESLFTQAVDLSANTYRSFYLVNKAGSLEGLTISDELSVGSADKAYIRFINLSPDAPALDLAKKDETTSLFNDKAYKTASGFIAVDAGTYNLNAKETSTGTVKASLAGTTFVGGYHYDVICGGLINPSTDVDKAINIQAIMIK